MSTLARPLADRLAAASDAQLTELLLSRGVRPDVPWSDFFDAAEALLEPASIDRALAGLSLPQARALRRLVTHPQDANIDEDTLALLGTRGLLDAEGRVSSSVSAALESLPTLPSVTDDEVAPATAADAAHAAEHVSRALRALADLLLSARRAPLAVIASGALSATERRNLAGEDEPDALRELAESVGLARAVDRELRVTAATEAWLQSSFAERWTSAAEAFRAALPSALRAGQGWIPLTQWSNAYPWDPTWPDHARRLQRLALLLGLRAEDGGETPWAQRLRRGERGDAAALAAHLPTEVDQLFLQNDLTAIAPGPLLPAIDIRLRSMTEQDGSAQISSYRFTEDAIASALVEGESGDGILTFLREISLTGVPQPLEYLVGQTAARHGLVKVGPDGTGGTRVVSADAHLLETIAIDRNLRPIGLVRDGEALLSRVGAESVAWALSDARYPATLVDRDGATVAGSRRRVAPAPPTSVPDYGPLLARMRTQQGPDADAAWLDRELEAAVRTRAHVVVEVSMPDGSSRELILEASGIGGGRLRGLDRAADVERTLPVRSIRSVRVLED